VQAGKTPVKYRCDPMPAAAPAAGCLLHGRVNGVDLLNAFHRMAPHIPVALMSGRDTSEVDLPVDACVLRKPFRVGQVVRALFTPS